MICCVVVYLVSLGAREQTYEEALQEQAERRKKEEKDKKDKKKAATSAKQQAKKAKRSNANKQVRKGYVEY